MADLSTAEQTAVDRLSAAIAADNSATTDKIAKFQAAKAAQDDFNTTLASLRAAVAVSNNAANLLTGYFNSSPTVATEYGQSLLNDAITANAAASTLVTAIAAKKTALIAAVSDYNDANTAAITAETELNAASTALEVLMKNDYSYDISEWTPQFVTTNSDTVPDPGKMTILPGFEVDRM